MPAPETSCWELCRSAARHLGAMRRHRGRTTVAMLFVGCVEAGVQDPRCAWRRQQPWRRRHSRCCGSKDTHQQHGQQRSGRMMEHFKSRPVGVGRRTEELGESKVAVLGQPRPRISGALYFACCAKWGSSRQRYQRFTPRFRLCPSHRFGEISVGGSSRHRNVLVAVPFE